MGHYIDERADFGIIRYANCWEDADVLCASLEAAPGKRMLSIASAGDNALALIAEGCDVIAVDLSPAQLACVELRREAFRELDYDETLAFLGVTEASQREHTYQRLSGGLSSGAKGYWDANGALIAAGVIHAGKFESYFKKFRQRVLPLVHGRARVLELLQEKSLEARRDFYDRRWNSWRWRLLFRVFFSRFMMGRLGRDLEFFRYVEGSVANRILQRTEYALTALPTHANPYLQYILTGNYGAVLPRYLRRENYEAIRSGLERLTLFEGSIEDAATHYGQQRFDGYNLSDIFEYLDETTCQLILEKLLAVANTGARLTYWNMLVPRQRPDQLADRIRSLSNVAEEQFLQDLAFFYSRLVVEEVC
jgi:S-adenosylmethionine-diacylglycerol 3-amino-3-carboxypropyl transferase